MGDIMKPHLLLIAAAASLAAQQIPKMPMAAPFENTARYRWLNKPVHETRLLDDMEELARWSQRNTFGYGEPAPVRSEIVLTTERVKSGQHSIRLRSRTTGDKAGPQMGRPFGSASVIRGFDGEDWSRLNRLSFWVYPDLPGFHIVSLLVVLHSDGRLKSPGPARVGMNFLLLNNHAWNHVVWEIPDLPRDKVTGMEFQYRMQGHEPGAADTATFYFDQLELQRVDTDHFEGWNVAPGRIAYSHTGYPAGAAKTAVASDLKAASFQVIDQATGESALTRPVSTVKTPLGEYQLLDFGDVRRPGVYTLRSGDRTTRPFRIASDIWTDTVWKSINYFYCQRCGDAVPGIHGVCHRDWLGVHAGRQIVINGGWHDAGDLCQGLANTSRAVYAMFSLAERLRDRGEHPALARRLIEEARWALDWILKTSFGDGARIVWATHDFWTNGIIGDVDDVTAEAANDPRHNFLAAAAEAVAARLYRATDPTFARFCLSSAQADWLHAIEGSASERMKSGALHTAAAGVLASMDLFRATGERQYADASVRMARTIMDHQQRRYFKEVEIPLAGFFWDSPDRKYVLHEDHLGEMHGPVVALARLCEGLPGHPDWIRWYSAVALYAEYLKTVARYTEPYGMLPASLYRDDEYLRLPEKPQRLALGYVRATREDFREQVLAGVKVGPHYYLRLFPVWFERRGHFGMMLPKAKALAVAAHLRGDAVSADLAERQLEWVVGRNPFSQSTMTGEGFDYVPHYSAMSGDIVGSLPVGIETLRNRDLPYWPVHNHMNTKETWVQPVGHWIWIMQELAGPALVSGKVDAGGTAAVRFREQRTGEPIEVSPDLASGRFRAWLPQGAYEVTYGDHRRMITVLPAAALDLDLRRHSLLDFAATHSVSGGNRVEIRLTVSGAGKHSFGLRSDNARFSEVERTADLVPGRPHTISWVGEIEQRDAPWIAVVFPDNDITRRCEIIDNTLGGTP